ncbi:hypothetical protein [Curtobacterium sp. BH-2-1-1]|uniref:hypothetical protein n=1 Tax=Curtobacterium sp. BH-2-1-1 TaxID=1905847 RepID=UPI0011A918F1|nr:hypothetical protein [Curtobacterium sp. BH-2-1-1]
MNPATQLADPASTVAQLQFGPDLWWQAPLLALLILLGSGAGSVLAERVLPSRAERAKTLRTGATETLDAVQAFHEEIYRQNALPLTTDDDAVALIRLGSKALIGAAKTGDDGVRAAVKEYVLIGRKWAVNTPGPKYSAVAVERHYDYTLTTIAKFMRKHR